MKHLAYQLALLVFGCGSFALEDDELAELGIRSKCIRNVAISRCVRSKNDRIFSPLGGGGLSLTSGIGTPFLPQTGSSASAGAGLLGAGIVKVALSGEAEKRRRRRRRSEKTREEAEREQEAALEALRLVDAYFATILDADVDDCGKKLVCEIETIAPANRTVEETLVRIFEQK